MNQVVTPAKKTLIVVGPCRLSYAYVWTPRPSQDGKPAKYSTALLIPKTDKVSLAKIATAVEAAKLQGKEKGLWSTIPHNFHTPLRDGDQERPAERAYKGMMFLNANSVEQPGMVDESRSPIMDKSQIYSGVWALVQINLYPFKQSGNIGIAAGLNNIMKVRDDEKFAGRQSAEEAFAEYGEAGAGLYD